MELFDLNDHVAVVTGGNRGIGLGMATGLVRAGAQVCIWGTNKERNEQAEADLNRYGGKSALAMTVDVSDEDQVTSAMSEIVERFGRLDSCFANAGLPSPNTDLTATSLSDFRGITAVNLDGGFVTMREAARHMIALGHGGSIVATSSMTVRSGQARGYAYTASKGALVTMIQAMAVELARYKIRANALLPGWAETTLAGDVLNDETFKNKVMPRIPARRWGNGSDFAGIAVYLASPASQYHTADSILIDGGYTAF